MTIRDLVDDVMAFDQQAWIQAATVAMSWVAIAVAARCLYVMLCNSSEHRESATFVTSMATDYLPLSDGALDRIAADPDLDFVIIEPVPVVEKAHAHFVEWVTENGWGVAGFGGSTAGLRPTLSEKLAAYRAKAAL